ncbi:hypothetical protein EZS27_017506 [termite gut metagenome]|uniref:Uncharacterized protein n=1 Tax=termite gut metagenome TaxID=433724 RepID=A0A5J4RM27_9ZZZZ
MFVKIFISNNTMLIYNTAFHVGENATHDNFLIRLMGEVE